MQFSAIVSVLAMATAISAHGGQSAPANSGSTSVDTGSCREYTYCMAPSETTGLLNVFGTDQATCEGIGGDQYCCSQELSTGSFIAINTLNNICGLNII